jgi:Predicted nucleic-acid-binding protein, contains PIN domain
MSFSFFDTNVLVYIDDSSTPVKQKKADSLFSQHLERATAMLSLQVLQEYFATVTRKFSVLPQVAQRRVEILAAANVVRFEVNDVISSIELHRLHGISFWDALILHAARVGGANVLYSEDFQHDAVIGGVRIINPFLRAD